MADQFDKQNSKENERKTERRHREFLGVIDKLQEGIVGLDKRFSELGEGDMDPDAKKVFQQIDKKTLKGTQIIWGLVVLSFIILLTFLVLNS